MSSRWPSDLRLSLPANWRSRVEAFDQRADKELDVLRGIPAVDRLLYAATELGDFGLIWLLLSAGRGLRSDTDAADAVRISALLGIESIVVNGVIKSFFRRDRPVWEQERTYNIRRPKSSSFPSGHASSGFLAAALLSERDRSLAPLYYATAAAVAASRAHVRIHHASDVLGGVVTGIVLGTIAKKLWPAPVDGHPFSGIKAARRNRTPG